jgi:hypothetical protein
VLARYAADPRAKVQAELVEAWSYFEPHTYAQRVLADAPLTEGWLEIRDPALLPAVRFLRNLESLDVSLPRGVGMECLRGVPALTEISAWGVPPESLAMLVEHRSLESVRVSVDGDVADVSPLLDLPALRMLSLYPTRFSCDLRFVASLPQLVDLALAGLGDIRDFSPIAEQRELRRLVLRSCAGLTELDVLGSLTPLSTLELEGARLGHDGCSQIAAASPQLGVLLLPRNEWVDRLDDLVGLPLAGLHPMNCARLRDLGPLAQFPGLLALRLDGVPFRSLDPLAGLSKLRTLSLCGMADDVDLSPLAGLRDLDIWLSEGQRILGAERLHKSTKIEWVS